MTKPTTDPFERAVARESRSRERRVRYQSEPWILGTAVLLHLVIRVAWGVALAVHWIVAPEPRWVVVLHSIVFGLMFLHFLIAVVLLGVVRRLGLFGFGGR